MRNGLERNNSFGDGANSDGDGPVNSSRPHSRYNVVFSLWS